MLIQHPCMTLLQQKNKKEKWFPVQLGANLRGPVLPRWVLAPQDLQQVLERQSRRLHPQSHHQFPCWVLAPQDFLHR
jgi:hypothetical protein